jgi:hypothetical protein
MCDARLGRFWSTDPLEGAFPWNSPYVFSENRVISAIELEGLEAVDLNSSGSVNHSQGEQGPQPAPNGTIHGPYQNAKASVLSGNASINYPEAKVDPNNVRPSPLNSSDIISRDSWGARAPNTGPGLEYKPINQEPNYTSMADYYHTIAVHHAGNYDNPTVLEIQRKHQNSKKADIGYHFAIGQDGTIYEGRPINIKGAHVDKANTGVIGIVLLGDYQNEWYGNHSKLTPAMQNSLLKLMTHLDVLYKIENGVNGHMGLNCGHTVCPGDVMTGELPELILEAGLKEAGCINQASSND